MDGMKKLFVFDFDGTLVDTITDVGVCFNAALEHYGFPTHPLEDYSRFVGGNLETVVSRLLPADSIQEENIDKVKTLYRKLYLNSDKPNTKPYPGILEILETLKQHGARLAINSNKGQALLDSLASQLFPECWFDASVGYLETRPSKPDPYGVRLICEECGCRIEDAIYIGDGKSDIDTAVNAGIPCVLVHWGQGSEADKKDPRVFAHVQTSMQLLEQLMS